MQISPGMCVSDVCTYCYEHTSDQDCPVYAADLAKDKRFYLIHDLGVDQDLVYNRTPDEELDELLEFVIRVGAEEEPDDTCHCGHPDCGAC